MNPRQPIAVLLATCLVACAAPGSGAAKPSEAKRPPVPVETGRAAIRDVPVRLEAVGTAAASELVTVRPQVTAVVAKVLFAEGAQVEAGTPLFALDDRPFATALSQAQATTAGARAQLALAEADASRLADLVRQGLASAQQGDQARSSLDTAKANLAAANAAEIRARLDLSWCNVTAPIAGRTGAVGITAGNLASSGQTALVTITRMQPMHVSFAVPATELDRVRAAAAAGPVQASALPDGSDAAEDGALDLIDNQVDPATATIRLRAAFPNPSSRLWPGQQSRVGLVVGVDRAAVTVPARAVQNGQRGALVWVVADGKADPRPVQVKRTIDGMAIIASGLSGDETVVTDGQLRLTKGAEVAVAEPGGKGAGKPVGKDRSATGADLR